ncbi:MAG: helix-turn-helix transcriptional regulator [Deltaproteobacteria bacterium]|nr:helix-turn-helix transcriptional regulator [Deltaproteobacteria bacterium]
MRAEGLEGIGDRVRELRGEMSLEEAAPIFGVSKSTLARYEQGASYPDAEFIYKLQSKSGISPLWLISGIGDPFLHEEVCGFKEPPIKLNPKIYEKRQKIKEKIDKEFFIRVVFVVENLLREKKIEIPLYQKLQIYIYVYEKCLSNKRHIDEEMMREVIAIAAPNSFLLYEDKTIIDLVERILRIYNHAPSRLKERKRDDLWQALVEKFDASGYLLPISQKDQVIQWLHQKLEEVKQMEGVKDKDEIFDIHDDDEIMSLIFSIMTAQGGEDERKRAKAADALWDALGKDFGDPDLLFPIGRRGEVVKWLQEKLRELKTEKVDKKLKDTKVVKDGEEGPGWF